jgi:RNA polymerase sigma factor (TIGR02999 family)
MSNERAGHTLQPTCLVHEVFLRLNAQPRKQWNDTAHFIASAALLMRQVLVDHARRKLAGKRISPAASVQRIDSPDPSVSDPGELLALDQALERLAQHDPRQAQIVTLRFFGGLSIEEIAAVLRVSERTVKHDWSMARAWLYLELSKR